MIVAPEEAGIRLDRYLAEIRPELSRSYIQKLIGSGNILVNGKQVKNSYPVCEEDEILCDVPEKIEPEILPENIPLDIVYEDSDVILINKPRGMVVHPCIGHFSGTLVNALMYHCKDLSGINGVMRPGIVHRIDRDTTGILVICKNDMAHRHLAEQLKVHSITRIYRAIAYGVIKEDELTVHAPIGRDPKDRLKMAINEKNGKDAITHVFVRERMKEATLVDCRLETGRTHQIRVHLASRQHPLIGDPVYGPKKPKYPPAGQMLHAGTLGFIHPSTGQYVEFSVNPPRDFEEMLEKCRRV